MSKKLVAFISSRNNYDMLENEVLVNNKFDGIKLINVDDNSEKHEFSWQFDKLLRVLSFPFTV